MIQPNLSTSRQLNNLLDMRNKFLMTLSLILLIGCKQDFMREEVFKQIDTCIAEYQKYHPGSVDREIKSKTCSAVKNRMCIINQYCKGDELCIQNAKNTHPPAFNAKGNDVAYCEHLVERLRDKKSSSALSNFDQNQNSSLDPLSKLNSSSQ